MKKSILLALLLALVFAAPTALQAQTRPRRTTGYEPSQPQTQSPQQPSRVPTPLPRSSSAPAKRDGSKAQEQTAEEVGEDEVVRVNTALVTIPVSVLDRDGRFIPALRKEDFRIFEDGTEQQVAYFATTEEPFTVALVLDTSGSTRFKLEDIQEAAIAFLDQLRPADKVIVVSFDDSVRVLVLTTFNLDEYVFEALRAGASGFVLKDDPPEQLIGAVHTVAGGAALLSPTVTRRVIQQFTRCAARLPPRRCRS